jgi:hypothetical protein
MAAYGIPVCFRGGSRKSFREGSNSKKLSYVTRNTRRRVETFQKKAIAVKIDGQIWEVLQLPVLEF